MTYHAFSFNGTTRITTRFQTAFRGSLTLFQSLLLEGRGRTKAWEMAGKDETGGAPAEKKGCLKHGGLQAIEVSA